MEKELSTIHEFFKNSAKSNKYKNVSEATKNIMTETLNSIHEVDSVEYCKANKLFTGEMNEKKDIFSLISFASIGNLIPIISLPFLVKLYSPFILSVSNFKSTTSLKALYKESFFIYFGDVVKVVNL